MIMKSSSYKELQLTIIEAIKSYRRRNMIEEDDKLIKDLKRFLKILDFHPINFNVTLPVVYMRIELMIDIDNMLTDINLK